MAALLPHSGQTNIVPALSWRLCLASPRFRREFTQGFAAKGCPTSDAARRDRGRSASSWMPLMQEQKDEIVGDARTLLVGSALRVRKRAHVRALAGRRSC